jgi:ubiquinone/menaquinone biosynthesis C-methylase UbiE
MSHYKAIAEYYDAEYEHQTMLEHDVPFFLGHLPKKKQSVLELATGTGRAAIPVAQAGMASSASISILICSRSHAENAMPSASSRGSSSSFKPT